jgi:hypothetical protein
MFTVPVVAIETLITDITCSIARGLFLISYERLEGPEAAILQSILGGNKIACNPDYCAYFDNNPQGLKRLGAALADLNIDHNTTNQALMVALVDIGQLWPEENFGAWRYLVDNPHLEAALLERMADMELASCIKINMMFADFYHLRSIASNPVASDAMLEKLLVVDDLYLYKAIAKNNNCSHRILLSFLIDKRKKVRECVAASPCATIEMLLALLNDKEATVQAAVAKRQAPMPEIVTAGVILRGVPVKLKAYKAMLALAPQYAVIPLTAVNEKYEKHRQKILNSKKSSQSGFESEAAVVSNLKEKIILSYQKVISAQAKEEQSLQHLYDQYEKQPGQWQVIAESPNCDEYLLRKMLIAGHDIFVSPKVHRDPQTIISKLIPRNKEACMSIARQTCDYRVLQYMTGKEMNREWPRE